MFKMKIAQYCDHNPQHLRLFFQSQELLDGKRVEEYRIPKGAELFVKVDPSREADLAMDDFFPAYEETEESDFSYLKYDDEGGFSGSILAAPARAEPAPTSSSTKSRRAQPLSVDLTTPTKGLMNGTSTSQNVIDVDASLSAVATYSVDSKLPFIQISTPNSLKTLATQPQHSASTTRHPLFQLHSPLLLCILRCQCYISFRGRGSF